MPFEPGNTTPYINESFANEINDFLDLAALLAGVAESDLLSY